MLRKILYFSARASPAWAARPRATAATADSFRAPDQTLIASPPTRARTELHRAGAAAPGKTGYFVLIINHILDIGKKMRTARPSPFLGAAERGRKGALRGRIKWHRRGGERRCCP